jgi:hypothetical protein
MRQLFAFRGLAHDAQGILTAVHHPAFVEIELCLNIITPELSVATFTHPTGHRMTHYDSQFALLHDSSLAQLAGMA